MVFKQLLTFALAGILVLETPATAYAAGQSMNIAVAEDSAGHYEMTEMSETGDNLTEENGAEKIEGGGDSTSDQSSEKDENQVGEESGNDSDSSNETGNTGNEEGSSDEMGDDGNGDDSSNESGDDSSGNDSSDETENTGSEDDPSDETGDKDDEDNSLDGTGESGDNQETTDEENSSDPVVSDVPDKSEPQEDADLDNGPEEEITDTVSANDLMAAQADTAVRAGVVTEISYEEASATGVQVVAPYGAENAAQYSFTAPADGRYVFYTEEKTSSTDSIYFTVDSPSYSTKVSKSFSGTQFLTCKTDFLKQGEAVTIQTYAQKEADDNCTYTLKVAGQTSLVKGEDGSYSVTLPGGENLVISADEGVRHLRFTAKASSGSWPVDAYYCANDHLSKDASFGSLTATASSTSKPTTGLLESGRSYDTAYVIYDSSNKFVALYSDILTTKTSETEEGVYIHNAKTDEENSITLDIEVLGNNSVYCYYAPEDGSSAEVQSYLYGWFESRFNNLKSGTSYKFEFRNSAGEIHHSIVYTTAGEKISASTTDSSAAISDDFSTMTIKVKPEYNGLANYTYLRYKIVDSLDKVCESSQYLSLNDDKDSDGYFTANISLMQLDALLQPGGSYQVELYLDFQQDHVTSSPEIVTVKAPEQAYVDSDNITFSVSQDETTKTKVNYDVQTTDCSSIQACIFYRPSITKNYQSTWFYIDNNAATGWISSLSVGATYDFMLYVGGATKEQTLKLDTASGIELTRVEDGATDYTGPYDIVRTYKMTSVDGAEELTGSYYLQLQYQNEYGSYYNLGSSVELNADNGYQATVSSIERSPTLLQPDMDYTLRWLLGKSSSVFDSSAEYCVYEAIHTAKAKIVLEAGDNGCNYQNYTVKLDADDIINVKANNRNISLYGYLKKESEAQYVNTNSSCYLSSYNDYSNTLTLKNLEADTRYELSLRGPNRKIEYAKTTFTTPADQRALSVTSADTFIDNATINYSLSGFGEQTTDYILCYYREWTEDNSGTWKKSGSQTAKSTSSNVFTIRNLKESTAYEYMIGIGTSSSTIVSNLVSPVKGSFTTRADERQIRITSEKIMVTTARIEYALQNMEFAGSGYVHCYVKETQSGEDGTWERKDYNDYSASSTAGSFYLSDLKKNTAYEYRMGFGNYNVSFDSLKNVISGSFTTYEDLRKISVTSVEPRMTTALLNCSLGGMSNADEGSQYLVCYVQEKDGTEWQRLYSRSISTYDNPAHEVLLTGLTSSTDYSYKIGFANRYSATLEDLANVTEGTFTTYADTRKVEITGTMPRSISANIAYSLSGMEYAGDGYLIGYVKKKADADAAWEQGFSVATSDQDTTGTVLIESLEEQTEYELTVGFGDRSGDSKENLKHIQTVTFTTLKDQRKLSDPKVSVNGTNATLSVHFEGNIEYVNTYVHFFYRVKGAADYIKAERVINVSRVKEKECSVTLTGLSKGAVYEFAAVLSENRYNSNEPDDVTKAEYRTDAFEFTMGAGNSVSINPTSIKLSQTNLYLNANEVYRNSRGSGYENLKAVLSPANAASGIRWSSSDESVATVSSGRVTAVAPGTATITAEAGAEGNVVSAACEVIVSNYQLARKNDTGMELLSNPGMNASKGGQYIGYTVCRVANDAQTETAFKVTSNNETVASWDESVGAVIANSTGVTDLVFETVEDHVKLYLTVTVSSAPGKGFNVTGFTASAGYEAYAAVQNGENAYTLAYTPGISYHAEGEIIPKNPQFSAGDFNWTIDKADVAVVDERGNVTPLKAGEAVLTITPKEAGETPYTNETCTVTLHIQSLASADLENATPVYALADISSTIGDVKFPDEEAWKGWEWKEPTTPLVINGVNRESYPFEAVYKGEDHYPEEMTVNVYIAKITGISAYEDAEPGHNQVVEVGSVDGENNPTADSDSITLTVEPLCYGSLNVEEATNYFCDVNVDAPAGVVVKKNDSGTFTVTATKKGTYTLTPVIRVKDKNNSNEKVLAKISYKIKAVEEEQAYIRLTLEEPVPDGLKLEDGRLIVDYDKKDEITSFKVIAKLADRNQLNADNFSATKLVWSITDKKVATVTASADTKSAEVKLVGEGHTVLTAKVKDAAGHKAELKVEIQNHKPRADKSSVQMNLAYDFDTDEGRWLAAWSSGAVELVPVYGETIQSVNLYEDEKAETLSSGMQVVKGNGYNWVICPTAETKTGEGSYYLGVKTTFRDELYVYPLKVKVIEQQATVTAKSVRQANLFYRSDPGSLDIGIKGNSYGITSVRWTDNSAGDDNGFDGEGTTNYSSYDSAKRTKNTTRYYFAQQDIQLTANKKLADSGIVSGTLEVQLTGYKKPNVVSTSLKWNYKKPVINTINASITLIPEVPGKQSGYFSLYNKTERMWLTYGRDSYSGGNPKYYYNELISNSEDVKFGSAGSTNYSYAGDKTSGSEKFTVTLNGDDWREPLTAVHTIKLAAPKPYLSLTKLTMNTNRVGSMYTYVRLKNAYSYSLSCADIVIKGKDAKSQKLLDDDLLEIRQGESDKSQIVITENRASTMKLSAITNGSYSFTVVPCYLDADGNRISPKALSLKITVTDKEITARTKMSRSLDLTKAVDDSRINGNYIRLDTTFQNIGSFYEVKDSELVGEYSEYFNLRYNNRRSDQRLTIANESELRAGQKYKLAIRFTLRMSNGDIFTVTGAPFTVKPKQTSAKIKVYSNNQTLYAAASEVSREYELQTPYNSDYRIIKVSGSLDCNKDGKADITVSYQNANNSRYYVFADVRIADRDGVLTVTGAKGKTYTIPVTVQLKGRDGITKDVKTSIKVTVKR